MEIDPNNVGVFTFVVPSISSAGTSTDTSVEVVANARLKASEASWAEMKNSA